MAVIDNENHYKTISKTCYIANIAYTFLRIFYLILFLVSGLYTMVYITAATIVIYLLCFILMKKKKYYLYALICGNEYFAFIIASSLLIGFNTGFHFYLLGLCIVSFFTSYFAKVKHLGRTIIWAGISLAIYLTLYLVSCFNAPVYQIDKWLEITLFSTHIIVAFLFVVFYLVVFLRYALSLESKIMNESRTDGLTRINNRYGLYDYFDQQTDKSNKVLALFDIDNFKSINDVHGHVAGDFILKKIAEITSNTFKDDFICRYGGEEFVVIMNEENAFDKLEILRKSVQDENFDYQGQKFDVTITIGAALFKEGESLEKWVNRADEKMYLGKNSGKNKTVY